MKRTTIKELYADPERYAGQQITVAGWCRSIRASNVFGFAEINDGSTFPNLQIVFESEKIDNYRDVAKLNVGASISVVGNLELTPDAKQPLPDAKLTLPDAVVWSSDSRDYCRFAAVFQPEMPAGFQHQLPGRQEPCFYASAFHMHFYNKKANHMTSCYILLNTYNNYGLSHTQSFAGKSQQFLS